jgi:hypothetical protein
MVFWVSYFWVSYNAGPCHAGGYITDVMFVAWRTAGMQQQFPFDEGGGPMPKRMRQMEGMQGPMDGGPQMQQQQQNQQQNQQQQRGPGWAGVSQANDYCQNFVDTGLRPQNYLGGELCLVGPL